MLPQFSQLRPPRPPRLRCPSSRSGFRHPRSHVDDLVSAELLGGISLLLPADTDLQTPLEGELGLNLLLLSQGKTLFHQLDPLGGPRYRPRTSLAMNGNVVMSKQNSLSNELSPDLCCVMLCCTCSLSGRTAELTQIVTRMRITKPNQNKIQRNRSRSKQEGGCSYPAYYLRV